MFSLAINPRFGDIDALGHVNNTVPSQWFEAARTQFMRVFDPELSLSKEKFPLILAHTDYDFVHQMYIRYEVTIKSWVSRIGTKSFTIYQEAWQNGNLCVKGNAVIVYFDFIKEQTMPIPEDKKKLLAEHML